MRCSRRAHPGFDLGLAPPQDFLAGPADWMRWISQMRATVTGGPNFAYALAHDFKQPIRQIMTFSQLIAEEAQAL